MDNTVGYSSEVHCGNSTHSYTGQGSTVNRMFLKNRDYFMNRDYSQTITTMILKVITYKTSFMISLVSFPINNRVNI